MMDKLVVTTDEGTLEVSAAGGVLTLPTGEQHTISAQNLLELFRQQQEVATRS